LLKKKRHIRMIVGTDHQGTSTEGLKYLLEAVGDNGEIWINHDANN